MSKVYLHQERVLADIREQAEWELQIEAFEKAVAEEKQRLKNKRHWFPWRISIINLNKRGK